MKPLTHLEAVLVVVLLLVLSPFVLLGLFAVMGILRENFAA